MAASPRLAIAWRGKSKNGKDWVIVKKAHGHPMIPEAYSGNYLQDVIDWAEAGTWDTSPLEDYKPTNTYSEGNDVYRLTREEALPDYLREPQVNEWGEVAP